MTRSASFEPDPSEALAPRWSDAEPGEAFGAATARRFEFSSRGDRVPGRLLLPADAGDAPCPLVMLQHGLGGSKESPYLEVAGRWVAEGAAVATIDFPLHGERFSAKLSERLTIPDADPETTALLQREFTRQSVLDLRRTLDLLETVPEVDAKRVAFGGFSLGAMLGTLFCAVDPRPRAAALALAGGGLGLPETDPCAFVADIAPRPVLFINVEGDETIPREAAEALHRAASDQPHHVEWFAGTHGELPGVALKAMWSFLRDAIELG